MDSGGRFLQSPESFLWIQPKGYGLVTVQGCGATASAMGSLHRAVPSHHRSYPGGGMEKIGATCCLGG